MHETIRRYIDVVFSVMKKLLFIYCWVWIASGGK